MYTLTETTATPGRAPGRATMKAIAVIAGKPGSVHLRDVPMPRIEDIPDGWGVLVQVLRVGMDGTDKEINAAEYGAAPPGDDFLILGHESLGRVIATGPRVIGIGPGDYVAASVRRPGGSLYDVIGEQDATTDDIYFERGINLRHGYLSEYYVEDARYLVRVPGGLKEVGVLMEPTSVVEKGIHQAYEIQRRLRVWQPRRAAVLGTGTLGLLGAMVLKLRGLEVIGVGRTRLPYLNANLLAELGIPYVSTLDHSLAEVASAHGPFDLMLEGTGNSALVFEAMQVLGKNGVLVLLSVTGGDRQVEVPADKINLGFVLGNKVTVGSVNAHREHFELGARDLSQAELTWPGWLRKLLTHPVPGLENYATLMQTLTEAKGAIKVYCEVSKS
jgi:threonine dehydrogenase-like Zn-dependent dehydrogenase